MNTAIMTAYRIYRGFRGREVTIAQTGKTNGSVLALRRHARTSRSGSVCDPSSFPQTLDKTFYGGIMHIEMPSDLVAFALALAMQLPDLSELPSVVP